MSTRLLKTAIAQLVKEAGSWRAAGEKIGYDHAYLWKLHQGDKNPSRELLAKLGLVRVITYQRLK